MGFRTKQIHAGVVPDPTTGSILTPIFQSTTFVQPSVDEYMSKGFTYSRSGNPTVKALENKLAELEGGADCACFGTGMSAILAVMLAFLESGKHAIVSNVAYGGTYRLSTKVLSRFGIEYTFADTANADDVAASVKENTALILTETPANPTLKCSDIAGVSVSRRVHEQGLHLLSVRQPDREGARKQARRTGGRCRLCLFRHRHECNSRCHAGVSRVRQACHRIQRRIRRNVSPEHQDPEPEDRRQD